jgi:type II secretory pathway pseudopilin PulG
MRKLVLAIAIGILAAAGASNVAPSTASAAVETKVVIVVGATQGVTASYRAEADEAAAVFATYTSNIIKVYSPNATWAAVSAAAVGANILVYLGHGSGYPNPYVSWLQPDKDNGMGLNAATGGSDNVTVYYGQNYMARLRLAPNAVVLLNHLCYASGDNEWGQGLPALDVAKTRVDGYASGFLRGGARAVIADGIGDLSAYITRLFTSPPGTTIYDLWTSVPNFHHHEISYPSSQSAGFTSKMDPDIDHPAPDGDYYYRSMVSIPTLLTGDAISGVLAPFSSKAGTYHPVTPTRVADTRGNGVGPLGKLTSRRAYTFLVAHAAGIPDDAIAITANLTVTNQKAAGWVYLGPTIDSEPGSSTINFPVSDNRANGLTVALSGTGTVDAWYRGATSSATIDIIIDVTGYYTPDTTGYGYVQYGPRRILDTRDGTGLAGKFQSRIPRTIRVAGEAGLPATGIVAVVGNVTIVRPNYSGYVFVGPTATSSPTSSTVNFPAGDIRANNFVVPLNGDGTIAAVYYSYGGDTDIVIDISGYFMAGTGAQFHTLLPTRILDSRTPLGLTGPIPPNTPQTLTVCGGVVPTGALAITANLTVVGQTKAGFASVGPTIEASSPFSNLNYPYGDVRANGLTTPLTAGGTVQLVIGPPEGGSAHLVLDLSGYFQ